MRNYSTECMGTITVKTKKKKKKKKEEEEKKND